MWTPQRQGQLRAEAMEWLSARTRDGLDSLTSDAIGEFAYEGERFRLMDPQRGIRKPATFSSALSIRTVWRPEGADRPYEDDIGIDGRLRYKWRGTDPNHAENRALRAAMDSGQPLIWFWGVGNALYQAIFPIYVVLAGDGGPVGRHRDAQLARQGQTPVADAAGVFCCSGVSTRPGAALAQARSPERAPPLVRRASRCG